ncbi:hypothetical protein AB3M81_08300 [Aeromicrobium sp. 179-A 4D2 NHS]
MVFPADRTKTTAALHANQLFTPLEGGLSTDQRLDPYWDRMWVSGSIASWTNYDGLARTSNVGVTFLPKAYQISEEVAWAQVMNNRTMQETLRFLAVLTSWRTLSGEQIEAMSGCRGAANPRSKLISALFRLGIIEIGYATTNAFITKSGLDRTVLYRIGNEKAIEPLLADLTYTEWVSLTGGQGWERGGQFDRHNVLATEFGLRCAEFIDLSGVLGEKFTTTDLLAGSGIGRPTLEDRRSADLCLVRPDGLRIAVEITASAGESFTRKVERWAELINDRPLNDSGFMMLFVIAAPEGRADALRAEVYKKIASILRRYPGTARESVAARFAVASWTEFFPGRHQISERFLDLVVDTPTGDLFAGDQSTWEEVSLTDASAIPFEPTDFGLNAILDNIHLLWQSPTWTRMPELAPDLVPTMLAQSGETTIPVPPFQKSDRAFKHTHLPSAPTLMTSYM